jgi:hypothetical protein
MTALIRIVISLCFFALASCNERSPTDPLIEGPQPITALSLQGNWTGELRAFPEGEDWSSVRLSIDTANESISGQLVPRVGPAHAVTGEFNRLGAMISIPGLPETRQPCHSVSIIAQAIEYRRGQPVALLGRLSGRCPSTLAQAVRLTRA